MSKPEKVAQPFSNIVADVLWIFPGAKVISTKSEMEAWLETLGVSEAEVGAILEEVSRWAGRVKSQGPRSVYRTSFTPICRVCSCAIPLDDEGYQNLWDHHCGDEAKPRVAE